MDFDRPITVDPSYSLDDAIRDSIEAEAAYGHVDLGPVDTLDPEALAEAYNLFFGTSPMSTPPSSTPPSPTLGPIRPAYQPISLELNLEYDKTHGTSPLSSLTPSPSSSPPSSPPPTNSSLPTSEPTLEPDLPVNHRADLNSNARRNKKKGHGNRRRKRSEARSQQNKNTAVYSKAAKIIAGAAVTQTDYDTSSIPAASTGFIALTDRAERLEEVHKTEKLLASGNFTLIPNDGEYAPTLLHVPH